MPSWASVRKHQTDAKVGDGDLAAGGAASQEIGIRLDRKTFLGDGCSWWSRIRLDEAGEIRARILPGPREQRR